MSAWLLLVREVHAAGGVLPPADALNYTSRTAVVARQYGLLEPGVCGRHDHVLRLTPRGKQVAEGRLRKTDARIGRWHATWLSALPVGVRLTPAVHRAQDDGSCYW